MMSHEKAEMAKEADELDVNKDGKKRLHRRHGGAHEGFRYGQENGHKKGRKSDNQTSEVIYAILNSQAKMQTI